MSLKTNNPGILELGVPERSRSHFHFTEEETEAQGDGVNCPKSEKQLKAVSMVKTPDPKARQSGFKSLLPLPSSVI